MSRLATRVLSLREMLVAQIVEFRAVPQHVVHRREHRGGDRDDRFLRAPATLEPEKPRLVVAVLQRLRFCRGAHRRARAVGCMPCWAGRRLATNPRLAKKPAMV